MTVLFLPIQRMLHRCTLTSKDIFLALAKDVPDPKNEGKIIANPYKTWKDVNACAAGCQN